MKTGNRLRVHYVYIYTRLYSRSKYPRWLSGSQNWPNPSKVRKQLLMRTKPQSKKKIGKKRNLHTFCFCTVHCAWEKKFWLSRKNCHVSAATKKLKAKILNIITLFTPHWVYTLPESTPILLYDVCGKKLQVTFTITNVFPKLSYCLLTGSHWHGIVLFTNSFHLAELKQELFRLCSLFVDAFYKWFDLSNFPLWL